MTQDFLPQFRRRLYDWLQLKLTNSRMPFRRVEETPRLAVGQTVAIPDLVLWINRDSLLAGALILVPGRVDPLLLQEGGHLASSLGLCQFVTWGRHSVDIWEVADEGVRQLHCWTIPAADSASAEVFTAVFEQLLLTLKNLAVSAMLPAERLPATYFANLCRLVLHDIEPALQESARVSAQAGQPDAYTLRKARDKGWLSVWRLLSLLWHESMPPGIDPERLERACGYALADLDPAISRQLRRAEDELSLPTNAAVRLHHLAGRLSQLGWHREPQRAQATISLLLAETAHDCQVEFIPETVPSDAPDLLVNRLPASLSLTSKLVAPQPCLAGLFLAASSAGTTLPAWVGDELAALPAGCIPKRIEASLHDPQPLPPSERRRRLTALRRPWPYRRFQLASNTPAWLWDALHLGGTIDADGSLLLTLPADWTAAPGADLLWRSLSEHLTLAKILCCQDGRQTLTLVGHQQDPDALEVHYPDGSCRRHPLLSDDDKASTVAALTSGVQPPSKPSRQNRRKPQVLAENIIAKVFCDGLPHFPGDYLRRLDCTELRTYRLPGPLHADSRFFDRVCLRASDGTMVMADDSATAEALLLASRDGRSRVDLPVDPVLTARLTAAYRGDLLRLWKALLDECRRHHPVQRHALVLARKLWCNHGLPSQEID